MKSVDGHIDDKIRDKQNTMLERIRREHTVQFTWDVCRVTWMVFGDNMPLKVELYRELKI